MNDNVRRALEALQSGADELRSHTSLPAARVRTRLRETADQILSHLEADEREQPAQSEEIFGHLDRQARDIAEDLRRADELMKRRLRGE